MNYFGKVNSSEQLITDDSFRENYILMNCERPTSEHIANENGEWVLPITSLEELKAKKRIELDVLTGQKITGGFNMPIGDKIVKFDSDIETQITMQGIAVNAENEEFIKRYPEGVPIRGVAENKTEKEKFYLNGVGVLAFCVYLSEHIGQCKQRGWELQQAVDLAETVEELEELNW